jgi:hypothetical protein
LLLFIVPYNQGTMKRSVQKRNQERFEASERAEKKRKEHRRRGREIRSEMSEDEMECRRKRRALRAQVLQVLQDIIDSVENHVQAEARGQAQAAAAQGEPWHAPTMELPTRKEMAAQMGPMGGSVGLVVGLGPNAQ